MWLTGGSWSRITMNDVRGHSCLLLGYKLDDTPTHVVCSPKEDYLAVITAYIPNREEWEYDYKRRRRR
jgi:hypothetical protein